MRKTRRDEGQNSKNYVRKGVPEKEGSTLAILGMGLVDHKILGEKPLTSIRGGKPFAFAYSLAILLFLRCEIFSVNLGTFFALKLDDS